MFGRWGSTFERKADAPSSGYSKETLKGIIEVLDSFAYFNLWPLRIWPSFDLGFRRSAKGENRECPLQHPSKVKCRGPEVFRGSARTNARLPAMTDSRLSLHSGRARFVVH